MKKKGRIAITLAVIAAVGVNALRIGAVCALREDLKLLSQKSLRQILSIHARLNDIEEKCEEMEVIYAVGTEADRTETSCEDECQSALVETTVESSGDALAETATEEMLDSADSVPVFTETHDPHAVETFFQDSVECGTGDGDDREDSVDTGDTAYGDETLLEIEETDTQKAWEPLYEIRAYRDIIGVFDADGNLISTCNVYVMTLPVADRDALNEGVWLDSYESVQAFIDRFR